MKKHNYYAKLNPLKLIGKKSLEEQVRESIRQSLEHIAIHTARAYGCEAAFEYGVVNSASSMLNPWDNTKRQRVRGVVISTLDAQRANGKSRITELNYVGIPYPGNES